ncbi:MAG: MFS transporter [Beijerinckiaceae bacterium]
MIAALAPVAALLASVFILISGHGLTSTLVPLAGTSFAFSAEAIGLLGSAYFAGMLLGSFVVAFILKEAGHIRAFAALAVVAMAAILLLPIFVNEKAWMVLRFIHGFCIACLYTAIESWINAKAEVDWRARLLGAYNIMHFAGSALGQQALTFIPPTHFSIFSLAGMAMALAILPLAFTRAEPPEPPQGKRLRVGWLFGIAPVSAATAILIGWANASFWSLAPVWGAKLSYTPADVAYFMTATIIGCAAGQIPAGYVGDKYGRRLVLGIMAAIAMMGSLIITQISDRAAAASLGFLLGITMPTLYVMCSAHANDRAGPNFTVEVSSSVLFLYCAGAFIGPVIAAILMERFGANALYWHNAGIYGLMLVYVVIRVRMRPPPVQRPEEELEPSRLK